MTDIFFFMLFYCAPGFVTFWREMHDYETWAINSVWYGRWTLYVACAIESLFWPFLWSVVRR